MQVQIKNNQKSPKLLDKIVDEIDLYFTDQTIKPLGKTQCPPALYQASAYVRHSGNQGARIQYLRYFDQLTNLPNRKYFMEEIRKITGLAKLEPLLLAVILIDVDRFKFINDSMGIATGDHCLKIIGARILSSLSKNDFIARIDSDQFAVLLKGVSNTRDLEGICERIHEQIKEVIIVKNHRIFATVTIGAVFALPACNQAEEWIRDAGVALGRARQEGVPMLVCDDAMREYTLQRIRMETELNDALPKEQFTFFYQPIVCLTTKKIRGFEALIRWKHPDKGIVGPNKFIPLAEKSGLIRQLGYWCLEQACRDFLPFLSHPQGSHITLNVNVSSIQLDDPDFVTRVSSIIDKVTFPANRLKLELTESVLLRDPESARIILDQLTQMGISICLDDFGTGYSSLSYLTHFDIDVIKIDRSFVVALSYNQESNTRLIRSIINLGKTLGMSVVVEGLETEEQYQKLKEFGCDFGQGFLFAKPAVLDTFFSKEHLFY